MDQRQTNVFLALFSILAAFLAAELGLRAYQQIVKGVPFFTFFPGYRETHFQLSPFLVFGPRMDWQIPDKANAATAYFNCQGFRTREVVGPKSLGEYRIIVLGGSTTENVWNDAGSHWPLELERALHQAGRTDVRVYNAAMSAFTTAHTLIRLEFDILEYEPDLVVVMHNVNDLHVLYSGASQGLPIDPHYSVTYASKGMTGYLDDKDVVLSRLWHSIRVRIGPRRHVSAARLEDYELSTGRRYFERNLRSMAAVTGIRGSRLLLLTMPFAQSDSLYDVLAEYLGPWGALPQAARYRADVASYNKAILAVGTETDTPVIDMAGLMETEDELFVDGVHYSTEGIKYFGRSLASALLPLLPERETREDAGNESLSEASSDWPLACR